jgi:glutaminyl-tRNA synthetase
MVDIAFLEFCLREDLNKKAMRVMAVLDPVKLIIENWDEHFEPCFIDSLSAVNNPEDPSYGSRNITFSRELWIERSDFEENPPPKYFRLFPGNQVRLRYAYIVTCTGCDKDSSGNVTAVRCTIDPATRGGNAANNSKVKGTIHWVDSSSSVPIKAHLYDYLFTPERAMEIKPKPDGSEGDFTDNLNPNSLTIIHHAEGEACLANAKPLDSFQFERLGYFVRDLQDGPDGKPVFNKTIGLRDTWAKIAGKGP